MQPQEDYALHGEPYAVSGGGYSPNTRGSSRPTAHPALFGEDGRVPSIATTMPPPVIPRHPLRANRLQSAGNTTAESCFAHNSSGASTPPLMPFGGPYEASHMQRAQSFDRPQTLGGVPPSAAAAGPRLAGSQPPASASARLGEQYATAFGVPSAAATGGMVQQQQQQQPLWGPVLHGSDAYGVYSGLVGVGGVYVVPRQMQVQAQPLSSLSQLLPGILKTSVGQVGGNNGNSVRSTDGGWMTTQAGSSSATGGGRGLSESTGSRSMAGNSGWVSPKCFPISASTNKRTKRSPPPGPTSIPKEKPHRTQHERNPTATATVERQQQQQQQQRSPPRPKAQTARAGGGRCTTTTTTPPPSVPRTQHLSPSRAYPLTPPAQHLNDSIVSALFISRARPQTREGKVPAAGPGNSSSPRRRNRHSQEPSTAPMAAKKSKKHATPKTAAAAPVLSANTSSPPHSNRVHPTAHEPARAPSTDSTDNITTTITAERAASGTHHAHRRRESNKSGRNEKRRKLSLLSPPSSADGGSVSDSTLTHTSVSENRRDGIDVSEEDAEDRHALGRPAVAAKRTASLRPKKRRENRTEPPPNLAAAEHAATSAAGLPCRDCSDGGGGGNGSSSLGITPSTIPSIAPLLPPPTYVRTNSGSCQSTSHSFNHSSSHGTLGAAPQSSPSAIRRGSEGASVPPCSPKKKSGEQSFNAARQVSGGAATAGSGSGHSASLRSLEGSLMAVEATAQTTAAAVAAVLAGPKMTPTSPSSLACSTVVPASPVAASAAVGAGGGGTPASPTMEWKGQLSAGPRGGGCGEDRRSGSVGTSHRQGSPQYHPHTGCAASPLQRTPQGRRSYGGVGSPPNCGASAGGPPPVIATAGRLSMLLPGSPPPTQSQMLNAEYIRKVKEQRRREFYAWNALSRKRAEGDENAV